MMRSVASNLFKRPLKKHKGKEGTSEEFRLRQKEYKQIISYLKEARYCHIKVQMLQKTSKRLECFNCNKLAQKSGIQKGK